MFVKIYFLITIVFFNANILAQTYSLDSYRTQSQTYEVKILEDSTVEFYDKVNDYRWQKTIAEYSEYNKTDANLIISLDTVNFAAYDSCYRLWGSLPATNSIRKFISVDANKNSRNEIYTEYVHREDPFNLYSSVRIYEQSQDSLFPFIYEFPTDTLGDIFDVGDVTRDGLLDILCRGTKNNIRCFKTEFI